LHIWCSTAVQERDLWEAKSFTGDPAIQHRPILIKGPLPNFWLTNDWNASAVFKNWPTQVQCWFY
jgi:hypothetical protein